MTQDPNALNHGTWIDLEDTTGLVMGSIRRSGLGLCPGVDGPTIIQDHLTNVDIPYHLLFDDDLLQESSLRSG